MLRITFVLDGYLGQDLFEDRAPNAITEEWRGYAAMEDELIYPHRLPTHECGCCLDPAYVSLDILKVEVLNASDSKDGNKEE